MTKQETFLMERYELITERITQIPGEESVPEPFGSYFIYYANMLTAYADLYEQIKSGKAGMRSIEECRSMQDVFWHDILPKHYETSYANPAYARAQFGEKAGRILTVLAAELHSAAAAVHEQQLEKWVILQELFVEAQRIIESERDANRGIHKSNDVAVTYPAIEIENLCRNHSVESSGKIPFGFLVFWIYIIPKVLEVAKIAGCEYVYIFAADSTDEPDKGQALVRYYRANFGFHDTEDLHFIRPRYDFQCYQMVQSVKEACDNSKNIWNQIEDIISVTTDVEEWF